MAVGAAPGWTDRLSWRLNRHQPLDTVNDFGPCSISSNLSLSMEIPVPEMGTPPRHGEPCSVYYFLKKRHEVELSTLC